MIRVHVREANGNVLELDGQEGESLMAAALSAGIGGILGDCGGMMACATCHVHVAPEWADIVGGPSSDEAGMLEMAIDPDETSRLSCQIVLRSELDGLEVTLPESQF